MTTLNAVPFTNVAGANGAAAVNGGAFAVVGDGGTVIITA